MGYIDNFTGKVWDWTKPFQRTGKFPLDRSSMFASYDDALLYAKGDGSDSRGLGATSYIGQTITVWGPNEKGVEGVWVYSLIPTEKEGFAAELKAIGSGSGTETADNYSAAKILSNDLVVGQLIKVVNEEEVDASGDSDDSDVEKITYKAGFYIVNAPGSISALDTSTGASDEIGALSNRVAALESGKVAKSDFETYQGTVTDALAGKVDNSYKEEVTTALAGKVSNGDFETYQGTVTEALAGKVDNSYKEEVTTALADKVNSGDFETYQGTVTDALAGKVDNSYKEEVTTALADKVSSGDFETYQGTVTDALETKATVDALNTLEGRVDTDIQNLTTLTGRVDEDIQNLSEHLTDYATQLGEVDDRLTTLEQFKTDHIEHNAIDESDIASLFGEKSE